MNTLNWTQLCALGRLRDHGGWVWRDEAQNAPNTLDSLVRRGLAEAQLDPSGRWADAYRITDLGRTVDLSAYDRAIA